MIYYLAAAGSPIGEGWAEERHMVKLGMGRIEVGWTEPSWSCCYNRSMTQFKKKSLRILFGQSFPLQQSPELPGEEAASKVMLAIDFLRVIHVPARMTLLLT